MADDRTLFEGAAETTADPVALAREAGLFVPFAAGTRVGRYVVLECVGQGGMGVVYAAYDPELDRKVALKLLRAAGGGPLASPARARLLREAQAMARVS